MAWRIEMEQTLPLTKSSFSGMAALAWLTGVTAMAPGHAFPLPKLNVLMIGRRRPGRRTPRRLKIWWLVMVIDNDGNGKSVSSHLSCLISCMTCLCLLFSEKAMYDNNLHSYSCTHDVSSCWSRTRLIIKLSSLQPSNTCPLPLHA